MHTFHKSILLMCAGSLLTLGQDWGQGDTAAGVPAHMIVTAGHFYSHQPPQLTPADLTIRQDFEVRPITNLVPLRGNRAALELYVVVDNCSSCEPGPKFTELRKFIASQPPSTTVGVAYIQDGRLTVAEKPTPDRDLALGALSPPTGSKPANPFVPLADLITNWNQDASRNPDARRVVLMISNGIDPDAASALLDPSAEAAIDVAERSSVTIFAIYNPSADYATTDYAKMYAGQVQLAHVANESGGEAYLAGFGPLPSLAPFLADIADHLANQYRLEFLAIPAEATGALKDVTVKSTLPDIDLMAPAQAWIPGRGAQRTKTSGQ